MNNKKCMTPELGRLYNDYMQEAHSGQIGQFCSKERKQRVLDLIERGVLTNGIDLYHAALLLTADGGSQDNKSQAYGLYLQAGKLGYPGSYYQAAMLYDSNLISKGQRQRYGTHWTEHLDENGAAIPKPLENPDKVDQWRAELGLPPLAEEASTVGAMSLGLKKRAYSNN